MTSNLSDLKLVNFFFSYFGGKEEVKKLGKMKSFINFYKDPFQIVIISPWSSEIDFISEGYNLSEPFYIMDESLNILKETSIQDPILRINDKCYLRNGLEVGCNVELETTKTEPYEFREIIDQTAHGDFFIVHFADKFYAFWVNKKINPSRVEQMLNIWNKTYEARQANKNSSRIGIKLEKAKINDKLLISILRADINPNVYSYSELIKFEDIQQVEIDYFDVPTFLYPETSWWMGFSIIREGWSEPQPLTPKSKTGLGVTYFEETSSNLFIVRIREKEILAKFGNASRQKKNQVKGLITFESPP